MLLGDTATDEQAEAHSDKTPVVHMRAAMTTLENIRSVLQGGCRCGDW
jgi:hypothetical protein